MRHDHSHVQYMIHSIIENNRVNFQQFALISHYFLEILLLSDIDTSLP